MAILQEKYGVKIIFAVLGILGSGKQELLEKYVEDTGKDNESFDASLHKSLHIASKSWRRIWLNITLFQNLIPHYLVTVVDNPRRTALQTPRSA